MTELVVAMNRAVAQLPESRQDEIASLVLQIIAVDTAQEAETASESGWLQTVHQAGYTLASLEESYRQAAADEDAEAEAYEWIEGLIGDVADDAG